MGKFFEEFKSFAVKGNAVDMAVGVIIGGAFGKIVRMYGHLLLQATSWHWLELTLSSISLPAMNSSVSTII